MPHKNKVDESELIKLKDILDKLKKELTEIVKIGDKELNLKYHGEKDDAPVILVDENGKSVHQKQSSHELYHDKDNHATFTVSKFVDQNGKIVRHVRGTIVEEGHELVIEPELNLPNIAKRSVDFDRDLPNVAEEAADEPLVRVYRRSLDGRLPTAEEMPQIPVRFDKRQTPTSFYVETLVVCDFHCFNQHANLAKSSVKEVVANYVEGYLAHVMNLADLHYQRTFENDKQLKISLVTKAYLILTTAEASKFSTEAKSLMNVNSKATDAQGRQYVNGDVSLGMFNVWLQEQIEGNLIPTFDIAVAFTNANLVTSSSDLLGIAPMAGTCTLGRNGVLVEDSGNFASGSTTAHEVAHNLGKLNSLNKKTMHLISTLGF